MDTFIEVSPGRLINKRFASEGILSGLSRGLYKEVDEGGGALKPVSVLSTDNAMATVDKWMESLNQMSPTTAPGYAPTTPPGEKPVPPKAYFANEAGQEAEYTEAQLKDEATRKFIQENGYVMTRTEGPSIQAGEIAGLDARLEGLVSEITTYNVDEDPGFKMQAESIKRQYEKLRASVEQANKQRAGAVSTMGIRGGTTRYAGGVQLGIEGEELKQATERIADINAEEADKVAAARHAYQTGKFSEFNTKVAALEKLRGNKQKVLEEMNKKLAEARKKVEETVIRGSRDGAIAGLVAQGITEAGSILEMLNYDDEGNLVGDFTAKEVSDTLKALSPGSDLKNLTGTVKEFYTLLGEGALPESITALPEEQQFFAYLSMKKAAQTAPRAPGSPTGNTITISEAKSLGLPLSVVGSSEREVLQSLSNPKPPAWFMEKLVAEQGNDNFAETIWNEYRVKINKGDGSSSGAVNRY